MNCNLTSEQIKELKAKFSAWMELQSEKKELNESDKDIRSQAAEIFEGKASDCAKLFKAMQKMYDGQENELDELGSVLECIRANGSNNDVDIDKNDVDEN